MHVMDVRLSKGLERKIPNVRCTKASSVQIAIIRLLSGHESVPSNVAEFHKTSALYFHYDIIEQNVPIYASL